MADPASEFRIAVVHVNGGTTLDIAGEIDLATAPEMGVRLEAVFDASTGDVTLDLHVSFLDSTGLVVPIVAHRRLRGEDRRLIVRNPSRQVDRLFELSAVGEVLDVRRPIAPAAGDEGRDEGQSCFSAQTRLPNSVGSQPHRCVNASTTRSPYPPIWRSPSLVRTTGGSRVVSWISSISRRSCNLTTRSGAEPAWTTAFVTSSEVTNAISSTTSTEQSPDVSQSATARRARREADGSRSNLTRSR